jgi:hypothetical protein
MITGESDAFRARMFWMSNTDAALRKLTGLIIKGDDAAVSEMLDATP